MAQNIVEILLKARDDSQPAVKSYAAGLKQIQSQVAELKRIQADAARNVVTAASPSASISARDDLKKVTDDLKVAESDLNSVTGALGSTAKSTSGSFGGLFASFTAANLAATAIQSGISALSQGLKESVKAASTYNNALLGLQVTASSYGQSASAATASAKSLASDGLVSVATAASSLKQLMDSGLGLDQAVSLLDTFKDRAAFGRAESVNFDTAVGNLAQSFKTESSELGDLSGMTENYSQLLQIGANAMGKNVSQLSLTERAQAKLIGVMQTSGSTMGNAARFADTYSGQMAKAQNQTTSFQVLIGNVLQPSLSFLAQGFTQVIGGADATGDTIKNLQIGLVTLAALVRGVAAGLVSAAQIMVGALQSVFTLSWDPLISATNQVVDRTVGTWTDWQKAVTDIAIGTSDAQVTEGQRAADTITKTQRDAISKMNEQLAEENTSFERSNEERTKQFRESMTDMIINHRDKSRSLQADLASENAAYDKSTKDRQKDLNDDLATIEESHADKVADITEKISDERSKGLMVDGVLYAEANQKKIDSLQADLDEEIGKYQAQVAKRKATYDEDVAADKVSHDQKLNQLQTELNAELVILNTHKEQVAAVGEAQTEDDLSRLIRQNQEAGAIADRDHQERLAKIVQQANEQGTAAGSNYAGGVIGAINSGKPALNATMAGMGHDMGTSLADALKGGMDERAKGFDFTSWMSGIFGKMGDAFNRVKDWYKNTEWGKLIDSATSWQAGAAEGIAKFFGLDPKAASRLLTGRASGGPVSAGQPYIVGEREPELFIPRTSGTIMNGDQIRSTMGSVGSSGATISIGTVINNTQADWSAFASDLAWRSR